MTALSLLSVNCLLGLLTNSSNKFNAPLTDCLTGTIVNLPDFNLVPSPEISGRATTGGSGFAPPGSPAGIGISGPATSGGLPSGASSAGGRGFTFCIKSPFSSHKIQCCISKLLINTFNTYFFFTI